jgi:hypothetical protein
LFHGAVYVIIRGHCFEASLSATISVALVLVEKKNSMKFRFSFLLTVLCLSMVSVQAAQLNIPMKNADAAPASSPAAPLPEAKFDTAVDDLPLMPGLTAVPEEETLFVEPKAGRIAESVASGAVDIDEVYQFYHRTLPHLGWQILDGRTYKRGGEKLRIQARADGKLTTVHFSIKPE